MTVSAADGPPAHVPLVVSPAEAGATRIGLPADLGFAAARALHEALLPLRGDAILDAAAVGRMSTAAVLVILSFVNAREGMSPPAIVENASGAFIDAFSELGLFSSLMRMEFRS